MRILLTNIYLETRTGTEIVTRDLALKFAAMGHTPIVFAPRTGPIADEIRAGGVRVATKVEEIRETPDVIHGHHYVETTLAMLRFPATPAIFVCHDRFSWHDAAPQSKQIRRYVGVDLNCLERLQKECGIEPERTCVIHNAADTTRFRSRPPLPMRPQTALVFSNYATKGTHRDAIIDACRVLDLKLDVVGAGTGTSSAAPELILPAYDIVFAKGRCALEGMATGNAVILCDTRGLGPMVTMANVGVLRNWNFGMRCLQEPAVPGNVMREVLRYDAADASAVSTWIRQTTSLDAAAETYLKLYEEVIEDARRSPVQSSVGQVLEESLFRSNFVELRLRAMVMESRQALPWAACQQIRLRPVERLRSVQAGSTVELAVEVENSSQEILITLPPCPVTLSYHWIDAVSGETIVFDGLRTALTDPVGPGRVHRQSQTIQAPDRAGRYLLRITVVQESVRWIEEVNPQIGSDLAVDVTETDTGPPVVAPVMDMQSASRWTTGLTVLRNGVFSHLGFASNPQPGTLTFAESPRFAATLSEAPIAAVLTTPQLASRIPEHVALAVCEHPHVAFCEIHNYLAANTTFYWSDFRSVISPGARIESGAEIPEWNVVIGARVAIARNVSIAERVVIGDGCVVHPGAVLGAEGFQTNRRATKFLDMAHAGGLRIGPGAKIFSNAVVARGVFREFTTIGSDARIGNGAFVSHNVLVGNRAFIGHGAVVNGNVEIGDDAWLGPNSTVKDSLRIGRGAHVALGATVIRDVADQERVMGMFAGGARRVARLSKAASANRWPAK